MINFKTMNEKYYFILILLLIFFVGFISLDRSLWVDEALILVNIAKLDFLDMFKPLPYYDQASPLIPMFYQKLIYKLSNGNFFILRLCTLLLSFTFVIMFLCQIAKEKEKELDWKIWLSTLTLPMYTFLYYSTEIKHYIFEFTSSLFLILSFIYYLKNKNNKAFLFSLAALSLGFSNIIPIGIILVVIFALKFINKEKSYDYFKYFIISLVIVLAKYFYMKYLTSYQISVHDVYLSKGLIQDTKSLISSVIDAHGKYLTFLTAISLLYGLFTSKENKFYKNFLLLYLIIVTSVLILKISSLYPVISGRHVFWLVPFSITLSSLFIKSVISKGKHTNKILIVLATGLFIINSMKFIEYNENTANNALISKINELCSIETNNIIGAPITERVLYVYQNKLASNCIRNDLILKLSPSLKLSFYTVLMERLSLLNHKKENYLIFTHFNIKDAGHARNKDLMRALKEYNLNYNIYFDDKNVAILYIYE
jgi:hypothetical protein